MAADRISSRFEDAASDLVTAYENALTRIEELEDEVKERGETIDDLNAQLEDALKEPAS